MASLKIGIVGLPNVGKSTLFNALTKNNVLAANYPFATIEPNTGIVPVPDRRIEQLGKLFNAAKVVPATVTFVDIAGIVAGAHKGEGMGNEFLSHIRETDGIAQVVRAFEDDDIQHVEKSVDPKRDIEIIKIELILADLQTIESHLPKMIKQSKGDPEAKKRIPLLEAAQTILEAEELLSSKGSQFEDLKYLNLMTTKPFIYVFNVDEAGIQDDAKQAELRKIAQSDHVVFVSAKIEAEISELEGEDAEMFMKEYGLVESGLARLSKVSFKTLGLQTYLTAGEKEAKAWTIPIGATAPQAAGVTHGDFEKGFIAADIVNFKDLVEHGSRTKAREAGKLRTEGKDYRMHDGDVAEFKFNT